MENMHLDEYDLNFNKSKRMSPFQRTVEELREEIEISLKQIENGEVIEEEEILQLLRRYQ